MNRNKGLPTASIILSAILLIFTCLSCSDFPRRKCFGDLKNAKVPLSLPELEPTTSTQDYKVAFNLGIALTDALACIVKEDQAASPRYTGMVYDYAKKLGVSETILRNLSGITAAMNQGDWQKVVHLSVDYESLSRDYLKKTGKKDEALLAIVAWRLEGLYITAKSVDNRFSPELAKLLRKTNFVENLKEDLESLSVGLQARKRSKP